MYEVVGGSGRVYKVGTFDSCQKYYESGSAPKDDEPLFIKEVGKELDIDPRLKEIFGWK